MEIVWQHEINGTIVDEPIGFDALDITLQRDTVLQGLENIFSDNITFWGEGAQIIKAEYELNGIDADLVYRNRYSCDGGETFTEGVNGVLNAFFYSDINNEVTIKIEPSGFHRKVKNRLSTPVNLDSNISIGGETMSTIDSFDLGLHSKQIVFTYEMELNPFLNDYIETGVNDAQYNFLYPPMQIVAQDTESLNEISDLFQLNDPGDGTGFTPNGYYFTAPSDGTYVIDYDFQLTVEETYSTTRQFNSNFYVKYGSSLHSPFIDLGTLGVHSQTGGVITIPFNISGTLTLTLNEGDQLTFFAALFNSSPNRVADVRMITDVASLKISTLSNEDPSTTKAFLIHEVFAKLAESMTDEQDSFRSDFFGRTNSEPNQYDSNGCGAWTAITNGLNIRKMKDKNGDLFPIVTSFQDLFDSANAVWNLGMKIEKDDTGKEYIRVEPKSYFYNPEPILNCVNISDLKTTPAQDLIFNNFKVGYEKWNLNIAKVNGIDEFNTNRSYTLPVRNANKTLLAMSKYIAGGYVIEQTRRLQYQATPTTDFETDNDLFFICTNRSIVESDLYTVPPVSTSYAAGTVSERDENFTGIDNVISPETCYNLRISPVRNAQNWYNYISASIWKTPTSPIKFVSGEGNYLETDTMINDCIVSAMVEQNQDLLASDLSGIYASPIYLPEYLEFTYPISFNEFITTMNSSEKALQVSCSSVIDKLGFIVSEKYGPNTDGGISTFKLIRGSCILGDFNEDFNDDFLTGNCD